MEYQSILDTTVKCLYSLQHTVGTTVQAVVIFLGKHCPVTMHPC